MKTKAEILERRKVIAMNILMTDYEFFYEHLVKIARKKLEIESQELCENDLNDHANDGLHTEQMDGHHSDTSTALDFDETKAIMDGHQERLEIIAEIYGD